MMHEFKDVKKNKKISKDSTFITLGQYRNLISEEFDVKELWVRMFKDIVQSTFSNIK